LVDEGGRAIFGVQAWVSAYGIDPREIAIS
jgi:hypothetical protein